MAPAQDKITIKIKSATAGLSDLSLSCVHSDSVKEVKTQVSEILPSHPPLSAQKLVYSGRILDDHEVLNDFLRWDDECKAFTFHLVCKMPSKQTIGSPPTVTNPPTHSPSPPVAPQVPPPASLSSPSMEEMMAQFSQQYSATMQSLGGSPSAQELAALQSLYNQYIGLYMQFLTSQGASLPSWGSSGPALQPPVLDARDARVQPPPQVEQAEPEVGGGAGVPGQGGAPAAPNAAMVMNAAAGGAVGVGEEEAGGERQRDVLDWVYVVTRLLLLTSIIYFHSSFLRLAAVTGLAALVYVLQNRRLAAARRQRELEQAQQALRQATQEVRRAQEAEEGADQEAADNTADGGENREQETESEAEPEEAPPSKLAVVLTFITSLVTSIVPEQNQVI